MEKGRLFGFIGTGNMGEALISGMIKAKFINPGRIMAFDIDEKRINSIIKNYKIRKAKDNLQLSYLCNPIILCVKPQSLKEVIEEISKNLDDSKLIVSIAAGVPLFAIEAYARKQLRMVRVMPNIAVTVGQGASAISPGGLANEEDIKLVKSIFDCVGKTITVDESLMDAVTGLSGSGPAYIFLVIEALIEAGVLLGISRRESSILATQTVLGSVRLLMESGEHPTILREKVTSPGGTTAVGLFKLEEGGLRKTIIEAVIGATQRAKELGERMKQ